MTSEVFSSLAVLAGSHNLPSFTSRYCIFLTLLTVSLISSSSSSSSFFFIGYFPSAIFLPLNSSLRLFCRFHCHLYMELPLSSNTPRAPKVSSPNCKVQYNSSKNSPVLNFSYKLRQLRTYQAHLYVSPKPKTPHTCLRLNSVSWT